MCILFGNDMIGKNCMKSSIYVHRYVEGGKTNNNFSITGLVTETKKLPIQFTRICGIRYSFK